jgi:hypothetical protein
MTSHQPAAAFDTFEHEIARLTDSAPPLDSDGPPPLRHICAWCPTFDPTLASNKGATHTICPDCFARVMASEEMP